MPPFARVEIRRRLSARDTSEMLVMGFYTCALLREQGVGGSNPLAAGDGVEDALGGRSDQVVHQPRRGRQGARLSQQLEDGGVLVHAARRRCPQANPNKCVAQLQQAW